jgi:hypothetical protein
MIFVSSQGVIEKTTGATLAWHVKMTKNRGLDAPYFQVKINSLNN